MNDLPTLTIEQKLMVREAQYAATRAKETAQMVQDRVVQIVQELARQLGVTEPGVMFQFDTLSFERHTDTVQGRPNPIE